MENGEWRIGSSRFRLVGQRPLPNHALKETATAICRGRPCACPRLVKGAMGQPPGLPRQITPAVMRRNGRAVTLGARASGPPPRREWNSTILSGPSGWPSLVPGQRAYSSKDRAPTRGAPTSHTGRVEARRRGGHPGCAGLRPASTTRMEFDDLVGVVRVAFPLPWSTGLQFKRSGTHQGCPYKSHRP